MIWLLVPVFPPSLVVIVIPVPAVFMVTCPVHTPFVKAVVIVGLIVPDDVDKLFVPV